MIEHLDIPFLLKFGVLNLFLFIAVYLSYKTKFPSIIFYIIAGILLGSFVHGEEAIEKISEIGIVLLFFYLGLEFNIERAIATAKNIWKVGLIDFFFNFLLIFIVMKVIGFNIFISLLVAGVAYASSSAITSKIIIDNKRIANPETEMILGLMVFEDIIAPIILAIISGIAVGNDFDILSIEIILLKIIFVFVFAFGIIYLFKEKIANFIDNYLESEILTLLSLGGLITFSGFTQFIGLSEALGAFLMGMIISETGKSHEVEKVMFSFRDLAVAIFFFLFGASIHFGIAADIKMILALIIVIILSIIGKFLTGYIGGIMYGLSKKASLNAGFSIINRGEFSIVMAKFGTSEILPFVGIYTLVLSIIGIFTAQYANKLAKLIIKPKKESV